MTLVSNNLKFTLPINDSGIATVSGQAASPSDTVLNLQFDNLNPDINREGLVLLPEGNWSLQVKLRAGEKTKFQTTISLPMLAGRGIPITVKLPADTPTVSLSIDQWAIDASVFVHGGCVSRDAFESSDAPPLSDYRARSSLVSAFDEHSSGIPESALESNSSEFQRRMLRTDLNSELPSLLKNSRFDYFLIDLIIERTVLAQTATGGVVTLSPEFIKTGLSDYIQNKLEHKGQKYYDDFEVAWKKLVEIVGEDRILVNRVYWASDFENGNPVQNPRGSRIQNEHLEKLYSIIELNSPNVRWLNYSSELLRANENHKWGAAPYHFGNAFYEAQREAIHAAIVNSTITGQPNVSYFGGSGGLRLSRKNEIGFLESFQSATFQLLLAANQTTTGKSALLSFELQNVDGTPVSGERKIEGLMYSHKPDIGWYSYVQTSAGINSWQKTVSLPDDIRCIKTSLRRWGDDSNPLIVLGTNIVFG